MRTTPTSSAAWLSCARWSTARTCCEPSGRREFAAVVRAHRRTGWSSVGCRRSRTDKYEGDTAPAPAARLRQDAARRDRPAAAPAVPAHEDRRGSHRGHRQGLARRAVRDADRRARRGTSRTTVRSGRPARATAAAAATTSSTSTSARQAGEVPRGVRGPRAAQHDADRDYVGMVLLALTSGLRRNELLGLKWEWLDFGSGQWTFAGSLYWRRTGEGGEREPSVRALQVRQRARATALQRRRAAARPAPPGDRLRVHPPDVGRALE